MSCLIRLRKEMALWEIVLTSKINEKTKHCFLAYAAKKPKFKFFRIRIDSKHLC